jgi:HAD superfamily hydrolase (TIGR01549 family)
MTIHTIFFDVGETLVDETRMWRAWADWLGVTQLTFFAALGAVIARGEHHRRVFEVVRPGLDVDREAAAMRSAGAYAGLAREDFYPDAIPCLRALRAAGYRVGLAGNQPVDTEAQLRRLDLPIDYVASSASWGIEKPSPEFFARVAALAGCPPGEIAYVGDRVDNDVVPAANAGMLAVFLRRGPWGYLHAALPSSARAHLRLDSLAELPTALQGSGEPA